jgi:altronate hydrolase
MDKSTPLILQLNDQDPVAIALRDIAPGERLRDSGVRATQVIPRGHKVALEPIATGQPVRKFGVVIGLAACDIAVGEHVHSHNLSFTPSTAGHAPRTDEFAAFTLPQVSATTFQGIVRPDGNVATRNYIGVLTTVNCSATVARLVADHFRQPGKLQNFPNVDGVVALTHKSGCAVNDEGEAIDLLRRTIAGYARHPNFAAVLIIGLGCEDNQLARLLDREGLVAGDRLQTLTIQETGGTRATVRASVERIQNWLPEANAIQRQPVSVSKLTLGLQCGGSDAFSALTANPALGVAADLLVRHGGTAVLSETPEIYGAEDILLARASTDAIHNQLLERLAWWEAHLKTYNDTMDSNPAAGNKVGGITTILEKSLGAVAKGGRSPLTAVYQYAEAIDKQGLVFMDTPGYDPVSVTGQVAGGANLICFTTGRGSCFGCKPVPSLKLATNTPLYSRMTEDMDLNCGEILDGTTSLEDMGVQIYQRILETASGRATSSEELGYGEDEFAPWQFGATL